MRIVPLRLRTNIIRSSYPLHRHFRLKTPHPQLLSSPHHHSVAKMTTTTTTNTNTTPPFPVRFYSPTSPAPDSSGRTLTSILSWPDSALEYSHDYIQNLFPLPERSPINPSAPIIDEQTCKTFRSSPQLQNQLRRSLKRMLKFYGFLLLIDDSEGEPTCQVITADNFTAASRNWITRFDHNHLRITRIIRSCRVLGLEAEAEAFYEALTDIAGERRGVFSRKTLMFWRRAAERPLHVAPEDENGERGLDWLVNIYQDGDEVEE